MQIQKITQSLFLKNQIQRNKKEESTRQDYATPPNNLTFEARVDKGLVRFFEANTQRMPLTLNKYIQKLADKSSQSPLQAQKNAFIALVGATTAGAIKELFPDEDLFQDLKEPSESKATRGILGVYRENKELLELYNKSILKNKENLTVWLVKKIFLEGKTIEEINKDFDLEMDDDFRALYTEKEESKEAIKSGTLKALGIKLPEFEYLQSLRYTRDGYSDLVGEKISQAQRDFYNSLPIEERTARARKSVEKFETWWNSMTRDEQLEMIAFQIDELEMLNKFNNSKIGKRPKVAEIKKETKQTLNKHESVKVESKLSRDDLFKIWAGNNLKLFEASLTDYDRAKIQTKREQRKAEWWNSMSPAERTEYINRLRLSAEPLKYAMIDAWNNCPEILIELSHSLKKSHFNKPSEILFGSEEFNEFFSESMTKFWELHPDYAERFGEAIRFSHEKIKTAINDGKYEMIKREISQIRVKREKETSEAIKNYREILPEEVYESYPEYMKDFIDSYGKSNNADVNILPVKYTQDYYKLIAEEIPEEIVISWTKALKKENLTEDDLDNIQKLRDTETESMATISRALEATLATVLYDCTNDPDVYLLSHSDCKLALKQIKDGKDKIKIYSLKLDRDFEFPILKKAIELNKIDKLYEKYIVKVDSSLIDSFIDHYIACNYKQIKDIDEERELTNFIRTYLNTYRLSSMIICDGTKNFSSEIRAKFAEKFLMNMPLKYADKFDLRAKSKEDFDKELEIDKQMLNVRRKYYFLPKNMLDLYTYELSKVLRDASNKDFDFIVKHCCTLRKTIDFEQRSIFLKRSQFREMHALFSLAAEQTLSDILYDISGNEDVYALKLEEMLPIVESIMLADKNLAKEGFMVFSKSLNKHIHIPLKKRIQPYHIEKKYKEYHNEFQSYVHECVQENKKISMEEILYILNPDENKSHVDELTKNRIHDSLIYSGIFEE